VERGDAKHLVVLLLQRQGVDHGQHLVAVADAQIVRRTEREQRWDGYWGGVSNALASGWWSPQQLLDAMEWASSYYYSSDMQVDFVKRSKSASNETQHLQRIRAGAGGRAVMVKGAIEGVRRELRQRHRFG
jgi:hypothetical protein